MLKVQCKILEPESPLFRNNVDIYTLVHINSFFLEYMQQSCLRVVDYVLFYFTDELICNINAVKQLF